MTVPPHVQHPVEYALAKYEGSKIAATIHAVQFFIEWLRETAPDAASVRIGWFGDDDWYELESQLSADGFVSDIRDGTCMMTAALTINEIAPHLIHWEHQPSGSEEVDAGVSHWDIPVAAILEKEQTLDDMLTAIDNLDFLITVGPQLNSELTFKHEPFNDVLGIAPATTPNHV